MWHFLRIAKWKSIVQSCLQCPKKFLFFVLPCDCYGVKAVILFTDNRKSHVCPTCFFPFPLFFSFLSIPAFAFRFVPASFARQGIICIIISWQQGNSLVRKESNISFFPLSFCLMLLPPRYLLGKGEYVCVCAKVALKAFLCRQPFLRSAEPTYIVCLPLSPTCVRAKKCNFFFSRECSF